MDADGKDDIVILSQAGELFILYATGQKENGNPLFSLKVLQSNISLQMNTTSTDPDGAINYEGLTRAFGSSSLDSFSQESETLSSLDFSQSGTTVPPEMQQAIVNDQLYYETTDLKVLTGTTLNQMSTANANAVFGTEVDTSSLASTTGLDALSAS